MKRESLNGPFVVYEKILTNKICIVFIHGLGGQSEQFMPIYNYFSSTFHTISFDLFGHGLSDSDPQSYKLQDMAKACCDLLPNDKQYIIVAHSMGVGIAAYMHQIIKDHIKGMVWIGAQFNVNPKRREELLKTPMWLLNAWRYFDKIGGIYSRSVRRYIFYPAASKEVKTKQLKWNSESRTATLYSIIKESDWPSEDVFKLIKVPVQLIVGEYDHITPINQTLKVFNCLTDTNFKYKRAIKTETKSLHPNPMLSISCGHNPMSEDVYTTIGQITHFFHHLKILCLPPSQSKEFKMDDPYALKNFKKWKAIQGVSDCIGNTKFRAMKIPREIDDTHSPKIVIENYKNVGLIVDMSRDVPPYHPEQFQPVPEQLMKFNRSQLKYDCKGDITKPMYVKQSFISKVPPSDKDVDLFVELCKEYWKLYPDKEIALHCHYGFNRTGFMIIAAMYKMGMVNHIMQGLEDFKNARHPGVK